MMEKKKVCGEFPELCYKFYQQKEYAHEFVEKGIFRLYNLTYYQTIEDTERCDPTEGRGLTQEPGIVTHYGFTENLKEKPVIVREPGYQEHHAEQLNQMFCFCTCLPEVELPRMSERFGRYIVKINHPRKLAEDINDYFISNGQNFLVEGCRVVYNKGQKQERELTVNERQDLSYRQKAPKYKNEFEFRFVAMKLSTVTLSEHREFIEVNLNKRLKYLSLVKEKPVREKHEKEGASIRIAAVLMILQGLLILGSLYAAHSPHRRIDVSFHNMPAIVQSVTFLFSVNILGIGALILTLIAWKYHKNIRGKSTAIIAVVVITVNTLLAIFN